MTPRARIPEYRLECAPDETYRLHGLPRGGRAAGPLTVTDGRIDGAEAVGQAIALMLNTERCRYPIYSWDYGVELDDLFGQPASLVKPELERRVREALTRDDRVTGADGFVFSHGKKALRCVFTARTIYGDLEGVGFDANIL